jgi:quinol monooxygenase YgiN
MVRLSLVLSGSRSNTRHLAAALKSLMAVTRLEAGCTDCCVWLDPDSRVHYFEEWTTEHDLERRIRSDRFTWLLAVMEASEQMPSIRFDFLASSRGLDYVAEVRGADERSTVLGDLPPPGW